MTDNPPLPPSLILLRSKSFAQLRKKIALDLTLIFLLCVVFYIVAGHFELFEQFVEFVEKHESWELDEIFLSCIYLVFAGLVFFVRRFREMCLLVFERDRALQQAQRSRLAVRRKQRELHRAAFTDALTDLPNRAKLMLFLEKMLEQETGGRISALFFFDVDRFKQINDLHGHDIGDALLVKFARRVEQYLGIASLPSRESVARIVARLGGDEFVAVVRDAENFEEIQSLAFGLLKSLSQPYTLNGISITTTTSIGVVAKTERYESASLLLGDADSAMYEAKRSGRGRVAFFEIDMRSRLLRRTRLERDLRNAVSGDELHVAYQPIVSLVSGRVKAVEALLRWNHPELGPIGPQEFVPIAEDSELIFDLGKWVLRESLRQMRQWMEEFSVNAPQVMSVNVSRKQFSDPRIVEDFREVIGQSEVPANRIQLEITEDLYLGDIESILVTMQELKKIGARIAIDDFGTGTSTFSAIDRFPIDTVKIDRSLVTRVESSVDGAAIVNSLASLVRNLKATLVAEGVENPRQVVALQKLGCSYGQGFYFSRPLTPVDVEALFANAGFGGATVTGLGDFNDETVRKLAAFHQLELEEA